MGSRGGFDNGMAGGCTPFVRLTRLMSKSSYARIHHLLPMHARTNGRRFHDGVMLPSAYSRLAPVPRDTVAVRVLEFASGFVLVVFWVTA